MKRRDATNDENISAFGLFMVGGFGAIVVGYPLWNDIFGVASWMKHSDVALWIGFSASAAMVVFITYGCARALPAKCAFWLGVCGWVLFGVAAMQQGHEIAGKVGNW